MVKNYSYFHFKFKVLNFMSKKNIKNIMRRNRIRERRHVHFSQTRHRKITQTILNFIYFSTIVTLGFVTAISLQKQIEYLFNEKLAIKSICKRRKLLSKTFELKWLSLFHEV